jgi:hypothetical protein
MTYGRETRDMEKAVRERVKGRWRNVLADVLAKAGVSGSWQISDC